MATSRKGEERRNEILNVAQKLFNTYGYEATSTNDILAKVNIARGTLYHHFKSKEDIMDALIERNNKVIEDAAYTIANDLTIPVKERFFRALLAFNISDGNEQVIQTIHKPQNALMHQKMKKGMLTTLPSILATIVQEGIDEGIFDTPYPKESMEMVMIYAISIFDDDLIEMDEASLFTHMQAFIFNLERLLNVETGSLMHIMELFNKPNGG